MTGARPSVSVVIAVHNAEAFLASTLESVVRQRYPALEIIVVDDGSTDGSAAIVKACPGNVRYVFQRNAGPPAARNTGLRLATGDLITFLDADDLWTDDRLAVQLRLFAQSPAVDVVAGRFQWVRPADADGAGARFTPLAEPRNPLSLGTGLFRRRLFATVGELDEALWYSDDVDWYLRARELGIPMLVHDDVVLLYHRHDRNITNDEQRSRAFFLTALKKSLDRRRSHVGPSVRPLPSWLDFTSPVRPDASPAPTMTTVDGKAVP